MPIQDESKLTQMQQFTLAHRQIASLNDAFMDMVNCKENPMSRRDLERLIAKRPQVYGRFSGFLKTLPEE